MVFLKLFYVDLFSFHAPLCFFFSALHDELKHLFLAKTFFFFVAMKMDQIYTSFFSSVSSLYELLHIYFVLTYLPEPEYTKPTH